MMVKILAFLLTMDLISTILLDIMLIHEATHPAGIFIAALSTCTLLTGYTIFIWSLARLNGQRQGHRDALELMSEAAGEEFVTKALENAKAKQTKVKVVDE